MDQLSNFQTWLDGQEIRVLVGWGLIAVALLWMACLIVVALAKVDRPRRQGPTDLLERLDREAPKTRPVHSGRKAGRTAVRG